MLRTWTQRGGALVFGCAVVASVALTRPAIGQQPATYESSPALYAAFELDLGGRRLYQSLFPNGWPTTKDFRRATLDSGEAACVDDLAGILGSGLGVPLNLSKGIYDRVEALKKLGGPKAPGSVSGYLRDRFEVFRAQAGLTAAVDDKFMPVFLPFRRGEPITNGYDETKPGTWAWSSKNTEATVALDSVGFAIYAQTLLAEDELGFERKLDRGSGAETFIGHSDYSGFVAFCGLDCAIAAMNELRDKLCIDFRGGKPILGPYLKDYSTTAESYRKTFLPHLVVPKVQPASVQYDPENGDVASTSFIWDQAAILLGISELARATDGKTGMGRFFANDKSPSFDPETSTKALDLALFVFKTIFALHTTDLAIASSTTTTDFGKNLRIQDAALFTMALEAFLKIDAKGSPTLAKQQGVAKGLVERLARFLVDMQKYSKVSQGYNDAYTITSPGNEAPTSDKASLAAQGMAIQGLMAAKRAFALPIFAGSSNHPDVVDAATKTVIYLEKNRWDDARRAYVDVPGSHEPAKIGAIDAFAVLGGLRDLALDQKDVRYLLRYRAYLATIRAAGIELSGTTRQNDADGVKKAAAVGLAPVVASEISLPSSP